MSYVGFCLLFKNRRIKFVYAVNFLSQPKGITMLNDFQENPNATEQYFKTPDGHEISWTKLLLIKSEVLLATGEEIDLKTALRMVDFII